jgi:hypothetical protein
MPCNISVICFVDQYSETSGKSTFVANAVGLVNSQHQNINIYIHIVAFYPKYSTKDNDLEKFTKGNIIKVQGRFSMIKTEVNENKNKIIKVLNK